MIADTRFVGLPKSFWAFVRLIGQQCGYTVRLKNEILIPSRELVEEKIKSVGISTAGLDLLLQDGVSTCLLYTSDAADE